MCSSTAGQVTLKKLRRNALIICYIFDCDLSSLKLENVRILLGHLNSCDYKPSTKNEIRKVLRRFLKEFYSDWNSRFKGLKDIKLEKEVNFDRINSNTILRSGELEILIRRCDTLRYKALIMLMYETAGRPEELLKLKWKDVDFEKSCVSLFSSKNKTLRVNPIHASILHLKRYKNEYPYPDVSVDDYVFPSLKIRDKQLVRGVFSEYFREFGKRVLGRPLFPYLLRHTRGTELQKVLPAKVYEKFMDHSIKVASRYSHLDNDDVRELMFKNVYKVDEIEEKDKSHLQKQIDSLKKDNIQTVKLLNSALKQLGDMKGSFSFLSRKRT